MYTFDHTSRRAGASVAGLACGKNLYTMAKPDETAVKPDTTQSQRATKPELGTQPSMGRVIQRRPARTRVNRSRPKVIR